MRRTISLAEEVSMWRQPPIWEPQGTKFRPHSITTLIFSLYREVLRPVVWGRH